MSTYAAYGTNLDPAQMARRAPRSPLLTTGWLEGWRLTFGEGLPSSAGALATVVEDSGQRVFVALYDVMEWDEPHLDSWEGVVDRGGFDPRSGTACAYRKVTVRATTTDLGPVTAWAYVLDAYEGGLPSAIQLGQLAAAAEKAGAPGSYVSDLLARECLPTEM
ncbi:gamma-glutamylcyclotransferase family protein [Nocardiopsis sp. CT-R113]|uniref:Gamma-glutamylcyclotransferase family protein n=1 Tax=Nocardiopsis codii TaxID=3065942 RepID=A0ABU7K2K0_9ACTN|nr:gamma-glutamylcyclotransferase family protein [Nocardiopsis sp. CT-R113]MEE2036385.1 gamma-glutamylcyclotransferase family protein [Nocardiopsis sp. CT-R113]